MQDRGHSDNVESVFSKDWESGHEYDIELLYEQVVPILNRLRQEKKLGTVVADIGCGPYGVSSLIDYPEAKIIRVDIAAPDMQKESIRQFKADLRNIQKPTFAEKRQLVKTRKWLGDYHSSEEKDQPVVDTAILSAVLNYLPYKIVLPELIKYIKVGGRMLIFNAPKRGGFTHSSVFHPQRAADNIQIVHTLEKDLSMDIEIANFEGMNIEELAANSKNKEVGPVIEEGYMLLVARKN